MDNLYRFERNRHSCVNNGVATVVYTTFIRLGSTRRKKRSGERGDEAAHPSTALLPARSSSPHTSKVNACLINAVFTMRKRGEKKGSSLFFYFVVAMGIFCDVGIVLRGSRKQEAAGLSPSGCSGMFRGGGLIGASGSFKGGGGGVSTLVENSGDRLAYTGLPRG